jgi:hypothetical protein
MMARTRGRSDSGRRPLSRRRRSGHEEEAGIYARWLIVEPRGKWVRAWRGATRKNGRNGIRRDIGLRLWGFTRQLQRRKVKCQQHETTKVLGVIGHHPDVGPAATRDPPGVFGNIPLSACFDPARTERIRWVGRNHGLEFGQLGGIDQRGIEYRELGSLHGLQSIRIVQGGQSPVECDASVHAYAEGGLREEFVGAQETEISRAAVGDGRGSAVRQRKKWKCSRIRRQPREILDDLCLLDIGQSGCLTKCAKTQLLVGASRDDR